MLGLLICGHGLFGSGVFSSLQLIAGEQERLDFLDFKEGMSAEELAESLEFKMKALTTSTGMVILTDIPGGTPFNEAVKKSLNKEKVRVVAGVNLPMILDGLFKRDLPLDEFVEAILKSGKTGIQEFCLKQ
ncbi:PTS sugar transporter subunit IIA [Listeria valentina]|uniref:PTS sugar transporter subunit IIA n=1 Tax=Listeria valentina TaxID=2705293 RepID=UPI0014316E07|nr:PTS sugar transporter subunit IIA [Listeria valentina]